MPAFTVLWWYWVVLGLMLMMAELIIPAFFVFWFGISAIAVGLILFLVPTLPFSLQLLAWSALSVALIFLWFKIFKRHAFKSTVAISRTEFVGQKGIVVRQIEPFSKGRVRFQKPILGDDEWDATAGDEAIKEGEFIVIDDVEGHILRVRKY